MRKLGYYRMKCYGAKKITDIIQILNNYASVCLQPHVYSTGDR
jgi:hypothetical protein